MSPPSIEVNSDCKDKLVKIKAGELRDIRVYTANLLRRKSAARLFPVLCQGHTGPFASSWMRAVMISRSVDFAAQVIQYEVEEDQNQSQALSACDRAQYSTGLVRADARRLHWAYALRLVYNLAIYALTHLFRDFEHSRTLLWPSGTHSTSLDYQQVAGRWSPSTYRVSMPSVSHFVHEATLPAGYEEEELMLNSASDCIVRSNIFGFLVRLCSVTVTVVHCKH
ncbi:hypothetical protein EV401DRAFT_1508447 [Pisolithus croceorrhizus]|nr:hypothetical protein EV401DRAFT_1508447 [Pisolithus croceorrhizus]